MRAAQKSSPLQPVENAEATAMPAALDLPSLLSALQATGGNVTRAAARLGVTRQRAYRLLEEQAVDLASLSGPRRPKR